MNKSEIVSAFNDHLSEFLQDIYTLYPENSDIQQAKASLMAMRAFNSKVLINTWLEDVTNKYKREVEEGDLSFFINKDYKNDLDKYNNDSVLDKIECLRDKLNTMSEENKEKTIKYLQNLTKISELYNS